MIRQRYRLNPDNDEFADDQLEHEMNLGTLSDDSFFSIRLENEFEIKHLQLRVDLAANFALDMNETIHDDLIAEFATKVGIMTLVPYIRQTVADLSQKIVGTPFTLPLIRNGSIQFAEN